MACFSSVELKLSNDEAAAFTASAKAIKDALALLPAASA
jgi:hypothetical protein